MDFMIQYLQLCFTYILKRKITHNMSVKQCETLYGFICKKAKYSVHLTQEVVVLKETDISKYSNGKKTGNSEIEIDKKGAAKGIFSGVWKAVFTVLMVFVFAGVAVAISLGIYIFGIATEPTLQALTLPVIFMSRTKRPRTLKNIKLCTTQKTEFGLTLRIFPNR